MSTPRMASGKSPKQEAVSLVLRLIQNAAYDLDRSFPGEELTRMQRDALFMTLRKLHCEVSSHSLGVVKPLEYAPWRRNELRKQKSHV